MTTNVCPACDRKARPFESTNCRDNNSICELCYELAGIENSVYDNGLEETIKDYGEAAIRLHRSVVAKGGNPKYEAQIRDWVLAQIAAQPAKTKRNLVRVDQPGHATEVVPSICKKLKIRQAVARRILRKNGLRAPYTDAKKITAILETELSYRA